MIKGRLGLHKAGIPHADRHGIIYISRSQIDVDGGCIAFSTRGFDGLSAGRYLVPFETISTIMMGPGCSVTHDVFRLAAHHGTQIMAIGDGGVRLYTAPPIGQDDSVIARRQTRLWADPETRKHISRRMYAWRFGEIFPDLSLDALRGMEGARSRRTYQLIAKRYDIEWNGRKYDRSNPGSSDPPNQSLNHVATAVYAAASVAVASVRAIPQLGFIHEDSGDAFVLDVADLYRDEVTVPVAFRSVKAYEKQHDMTLERICRRECSSEFKKTGFIAKMIDRIKEMFHIEDTSARDK